MKHILIDCDTGIDDSLAILYALKSEGLHVEGFTTVYGNTNAPQAAENTLRLIKLSGCGYHIPVVLGSCRNLDGESSASHTSIHGENGVGNVDLPSSDQALLEMDAADFILRKADELEGELTIVTLGRLTNLARALEKDKTLPRKIKRLVSMGGCMEVPGNVTPYAEANIVGDARAADMVLRAGFRMTLVGMDVTTKTFITGQDLDALERYCKEKNRPIAAYIKEALQHYYRFYRQSGGYMDRCVVHDPLAMLIAEHPSLGEYRMISLGVEHGDNPYKGMLCSDGRFHTTFYHDEILYCTRVDSDAAVRRLFSVF